jgi:hypothetical protein
VFTVDRLATKATVTVDGGEPISVLCGRYDTFMLPGRVVIPPNGVYGGTPGAIMRYGGHGFVGFLRPLPVGPHTLHVDVEGKVAGMPPEGFHFDTRVTVTC